MSPGPGGRPRGDADDDGVDHWAVVVGAGFGGLGMARTLREAGIDDVVVLERHDDLGGTWHANTYPGVAVDIASVSYQFSFLPNPDWSRLHAPGHEIKAYADRVADAFDLRRHLRFGVTVREVAWDDGAHRWSVHHADGGVTTCRLLVLATGFLSQPRIPDLPGLSSFAGTVMHTAHWDHDHDLAGERVAVIGTGATAVQLVPELAPVTARLDVHQRTPIWVTAKPDPVMPTPLRRAFRLVPPLQWLARQAANCVYEVLVVAALHHRRLPGMTAAAQRVALAHLQSQVADEDLRERLTPTYGFGCKRPTFSNTFYPALCRDDVELVTDPIARITPDGITSADGTHRQVDTIVLATGFHLMDEGNFPPFPVRGRDGVELGSTWREDRFTSYEGVTHHGCPNLVMLSSPFAYSGLSAFFTIESQMLHVARLLRAMRERGMDVFEPRADAQERFVDAMHAAMGDTVFVQPTCDGSNSYYRNEHGHASLARLRTTPRAFLRARTFPLSDYAFAPLRVPATTGSVSTGSASTRPA